VLMGPNHRAVDEVRRPVEVARRVALLLERREDAGPDAKRLPPVEARGGRLPGAGTAREVPPRGTGTQDPEDPSDGASPAAGLRPPPRFGQQGLQTRPLLVVQVMSLYHPSSVSHNRKHALVLQRHLTDQGP